jgi:hypothetical protein
MKLVKEDLTFFRGMLILASMSPVFLVWAILGMEKIPDQYFIPTCLLLVLVPHFFLLARIRIALKNKTEKELTIETAKDSKENLLTYFFPLILPLMAVSFSSWRGFAATIFLFLLMAFASWHLRVFYINIFFAIFGYRIFKITQPTNGLSSNTDDRILITKHAQLIKGEKIVAVNLGGNVYYAPTRKQKD